MALFSDLSSARMMWSNEDDELNPGETVSITLYQTDDHNTTTGDVVIDGHTVAENVEISGQTTRLQVPAPELDNYDAADEPVTVAGEQLARSFINIQPGSAETEPDSLEEQGYAEGSNAASYMGDSTSEPVEETSDAPDPVDPADQPGLVHADNEQGFALAPAYEDVYDSAQSLLSDAQDGTLNRLNSDESSSSPMPSTGSTTTSGGGPSRRQLVVGAVVAVAAGAAALLGGN